MKIIIIGGGKVGLRLAQDLDIEGQDVVVIDQEEKVIAGMLEVIDVRGVVGSGVDLDILKEAGAETADMCIAVTAEDELNLMAAMMAKRLGTGYTVARVRSPEYFRHWDFMRDSLGVSMMMNPELEAAKLIAGVLSFPSAIEFEEFSSHQSDMIQVVVPEHSPFSGRRLMDLAPKVTVVGIVRGEDAFIPRGSDVIEEGDALYITGSREHLTHFCKEMGSFKKIIRSVLIVGGGRLTNYLMRMLPKRMDIKIIEVDEAAAKHLAAEFPHAIVVHADGTNPDVLIGEGIERYDAVVALTGVDEENILLSLFAKAHNVGKIVTKVNREQLLKVVTAGPALETVVTPKVLVVNLMTQIVRAKANAEGSEVRTFHRIADGKIEVLEFVAAKNTKILGTPLYALDIKNGVILAYMVRGTEVIFPNGMTTIEAGDRVIIATTIPFFDDLDDILER